MNTEQKLKARKVYKEIDLTPYQTFGIPLLKLLFSIAALSLALVAIYEFFIV